MRKLAGIVCGLVMAQTLVMGGPVAQAHDVRTLATGEHQQVVNGVRLWYRVAGQAEGAPVVFLHGGPGQGSQTFARFAGPELEPHLRMVYLDQRGSGRSERPWDEAYSLDLLVEDLEQLRKLWGVEQIVVVGHSFGAIIALEYAARYPSHTERLILTAAPPDLPGVIEGQCDRLAVVDPEAYQRAVEQKPEGMKARCNAFSAGRAFIDSAMFPDPAIMTLVDETDGQEGLRNTGEIGRVLFGQGLMDYRFEGHKSLTMPVMIVAGGADYQTGVGPQRALASDLPNAQVLEYEGRGHFMFVEDPARFAADVVAFLKP